jgi:hypothetical protein
MASSRSARNSVSAPASSSGSSRKYHGSAILNFSRRASITCSIADLSGLKTTALLSFRSSRIAPRFFGWASTPRRPSTSARSPPVKSNSSISTGRQCFCNRSAANTGLSTARNHKSQTRCNARRMSALSRLTDSSQTSWHVRKVPTITRAAKGVFTQSQSSCDIAKVVLAPTAAKSPQRLTHHLATPPAVSSIGGLRTPAPVRAAPPSWGRHPQTFTRAAMPNHVMEQTFRPAGTMSFGDEQPTGCGFAGGRAALKQLGNVGWQSGERRR